MSRLTDLIETYASSLPDTRKRNWKSLSSGFICDTNEEEGHAPAAADLVEETEFKMTGQGVCRHCRHVIVWVNR